MHVLRVQLLLRNSRRREDGERKRKENEEVVPAKASQSVGLETFGTCIPTTMMYARTYVGSICQDVLNINNFAKKKKKIVARKERIMLLYYEPIVR